MRPKLSFANVASCLALFVALGSGAYAATNLPKNSVGTKQLKKNAVAAAKVKNGAITAAKLADGSITGTKVKAGSLTAADIAGGSLTGANIDQSTLTSVRASNVFGVALNPSCTPAAPFPSGVAAEKVGSSGCAVKFPTSIINCAATATADIRTSGLLIIAEQRTVETLRNPEKPEEIRTFPYGNGGEKSEPVDLTLVC